LQPGQQHNRTSTDTSEGDADGEAAPTHEPVRQVEGLCGEAHQIPSGADQDAECRVEMPGLCDGWGGEEAAGHHAYACADYDTRALPVHHSPGDRAEDRGDEEAKGKGSGDERAAPAELIKQWR
jgi:hypothetical protein